MLYYAEGTFTVDGKTVRSSSRERLLELNEGQIAASPRGHAEFLLGPSATLWTATQSQIRFDDTRVESTVIALLAGSAMVEIKRSLEDSRIQVDMGTLNVEITREGLYRFDSASKTVRVYAGEALLPGPVKLIRGEESVDGVVRPFDRKDFDELHYWSAYRSFMLENDAGAFKHWGGDRFGEREHSSFGIKLPDTPGAARLKYQAASEAGLIYYLDGSAIVSGQSRVTRLPILLGRENFLRTEAGKAEVFLGVGTIARMSDHAFIRMVETQSSRPMMALDEGIALIEVANSVEGAPPRIRVGDSVTELLKPGLYRFDATARSLHVYAGESSTTLAGSVIRIKQAQGLNLRDASPLAKFNPKTQDPLYKWSADRSFALFLTPAAFMTQWEPAPRLGRYKHKVFGQRTDPRPQRRPRSLPRFE